MKNTILILVLTFSAMGIWAQEVAPAQKHQFSINSSSFIKNFLSFNNNSTPTQTYQFMYRRMYGSSNALRVQLGVNYFQNTVKEDDDTNELSSSLNDFAIGFEKRYAIHKRWLYYFGFQGMLRYELQTSKNSSGSFQSSQKDNVFGAGIGGVVGLQFNINDRISLSTEGGLPLMYTVAKSTSSFDNETN